jgi:ubiquinone/menaquinone biosynthesis C-methylase UbiE
LEGNATAGKGYKGVAMEGAIARRYTKLRRSGQQIEEWRKQAVEVTASLAPGASVLEVAPGPGFFAIELARAGDFRVTGLDISRTFVEIGRENARAAGVNVRFELGDASRMPLGDGTFDLVVCQAAFKNFSRPDAAIREMHRVLRAGGTAIIQDMRKDASDDAIRVEVAAMGLGRLGAFVTRRILRGLRRRAYSPEELAQLAAASPFGGSEVSTHGIGVDVRMRKGAAPT